MSTVPRLARKTHLTASNRSADVNITRLHCNALAHSRAGMGILKKCAAKVNMDFEIMPKEIGESGLRTL